jgi:hypothetical protein
LPFFVNRAIKDYLGYKVQQLYPAHPGRLDSVNGAEGFDEMQLIPAQSFDRLRMSGNERGKYTHASILKNT